MLEVIPNSREKVKPGFLLSSMCIFPESKRQDKRQNPNLTAFTSKIKVFCRQNVPKGGSHENEF